LEPDEILALFRETIALRGAIVVSFSMPKPWTSAMPCTFDDDVLLLQPQASFPAFASDKNLRVTFSARHDTTGIEVHGDGIARVQKEGATGIRMKPYRISVDATAVPGGAGTTIERRQNAWRIRHAAEASSRTLGFWFRAMRGISFPLSVFPILIGTSCGLLAGPVDWLLFGLSLAGGVAAHAATNLFSDYSDFVKGVDTTNALSSHTGVLVDELVQPDRILLAAAACGLVTAFTGGVLVALIGWPILIFGIAGIVGGFLYTGGPRAFKYLGLGEAATGFLMGPLMVCGAYYVQARALSVPVILMSLAVGLLVSAVSFANNIRDAFFDNEAGITTMPARLGARLALVLFWSMMALPYLLVGCAVCFDARYAFAALAAFLSVPWAAATALRLKGARDLPAMSEKAARCILPLHVIRLHTRFCLFLIIGCVSLWFIHRCV
jgi:1,4-dihydroxy-2-naphthoate octaprenyltransferase